jgi:hypothetical protein
MIRLPFRILSAWFTYRAIRRGRLPQRRRQCFLGNHVVSMSGAR